MPDPAPHPEFNDDSPNFWQSTLPNYDDVPSFLKNTLDMGEVKQTITGIQNPEDKNYIAEVNRSSPYNVKVLQPDLYGPPVLNHELTHTFQDTRSKDLISTSNPSADAEQMYYYGGAEGLIKAADTYAEKTHAWMPDGTDRKVFHPSYSGESNMPLNRKEYEEKLKARNDNIRQTR